MHELMRVGIDFLESIFFVGLAGSALVILLVTFEDLAVLMDKDEGQAHPE